ncbi:hypothetical protein FIBSPDRAFT_877137 [Athelia psychrophila]|uniref:Uncharacterized protein n=1 Tax=Athelia psychrophila TaxID=1759441 RepID=A0A167W7Z6_9AGAM|nr:hypothetical protein FIBSPDRAFT_877137 [Fibularhizoctonia sp. CBS 109695]
MPGLGGETDVSRIDPEEVLVDAATVEPGDGDVSVDNIDEALLRSGSSSNDQVLIDMNLTNTLNLRMDISKPPNCPPRSRLCHPWQGPRSVQLRQHPHRHAQQAHLRRRRAGARARRHGGLQRAHLRVLADCPG